MFKRILCSIVTIIVASNFIGWTKTPNIPNKHVDNTIHQDYVDQDNSHEDLNTEIPHPIEVGHATPCRHDGIYGIFITASDVLIITIISAVLLIFSIVYLIKIIRVHNKVTWKV